MRLDHIALRVKDRDKTVKFFTDAFGYKFQAEFEIFFNEEKTDKALCVALEPPEKTVPGNHFYLNWSDAGALPSGVEKDQVYHLAPEIFVSSGSPGSIVGNWVESRNGVGGVHHLAFQVDSVKDKMKEWADKGYGEFTTKEVLTCPGLKQVFTKPSELTGLIFEFIERDNFGFCKDNVKDLMVSTKEFSEIKANADKNLR